MLSTVDAGCIAATPTAVPPSDGKWRTATTPYVCVCSDARKGEPRKRGGRETCLHRWFEERVRAAGGIVRDEVRRGRPPVPLPTPEAIRASPLFRSEVPRPGRPPVPLPTPEEIRASPLFRSEVPGPGRPRARRAEGILLRRLLSTTTTTTTTTATATAAATTTTGAPPQPPCGWRDHSATDPPDVKPDLGPCRPEEARREGESVRRDDGEGTEETAADDHRGDEGEDLPQLSPGSVARILGDDQPRLIVRHPWSSLHWESARPYGTCHSDDGHPLTCGGEDACELILPDTPDFGDLFSE